MKKTSINDIKTQTDVIQSTESANDVSAVVSQSDMGIRIIGLMQGICSLLIIVGLIVGIIYMIKSKKTKGRKILIGAIIIIVPFILIGILNIIKFNILLNI